MASLSEIWSFPVKSLPGIELTASRLVAGEGLPNDRRFAFTKTVATSLDGKWLTSRSFFINTVDDGLQRFSLALDGQTLRLTSPENQEIVVTLGHEASLQAANDQLATFMFSLDPHPAMP